MFAFLHREIHFKFGSVGCIRDWTNGSIEYPPSHIHTDLWTWESCVQHEGLWRQELFLTPIAQVQVFTVITSHCLALSPMPHCCTDHLSTTQSWWLFPDYTLLMSTTQLTVLTFKSFCLQILLSLSPAPFSSLISCHSCRASTSPLPSSVWTLQTTCQALSKPCSFLPLLVFMLSSFPLSSLSLFLWPVSTSTNVASSQNPSLTISLLCRTKSFFNSATMYFFGACLP